MKYIDFIDLKYRPKATDTIAEFYVERDIKSKLALDAVIGGIAAESSIGTWTELTTEKPYMKKLAAKVFSIKKLGKNAAKIKIAYPKELFEFSNIPNFLSSIAGNIFGLKDIKNLRLEDINFPDVMIKKFKGPKFGIPGIRKLLKVKKRPLIGTIIKPKLGLRTKDHVKVAYNAWIGGCDIVKDDENLSSQSFNKFENRLKEMVKAKKKAEKLTGEKKVYMINITAETEEMLRRARLAKKAGNEYVMIDILTVGWSALQTLRNENEKLNLVLHAHRAGHAAFTRNPKHGISMLVIAKLSRLIGIDQLHIGTVVGKMEGPKKEVVDLDQEMEKHLIKEKGTVLSENWRNIKPVFAVCSGGLHPGHVPSLIKILGKDIIIQMGGGIHGHPNGTIAGAKAARQAIDAVMKKIPLQKYAKSHNELKLALEKWK
jgi:ribulose-bisphosphate carboxylase large chain